jgi:alkylation response protein AidB-like acyl-CoA dehydrogenase
MPDLYPWWNDKQKELAEETKKFADENLHRGEEIAWTKKFPHDLLKEVADRGWFGAMIPEKYGGMEAGATGCCIVTEQLARIISTLSTLYAVTMYGGVEQLLKFGNEEQRNHWLPQTVKGKLGAICITEPAAGSDAASIETTAVRQGDVYLISGKKRFITNAGVADIYCLYAKTSERPEDKAKYTHLSAFILEKGMKGFTVEKINELGGRPGLPNGYLDLDDVEVPVKNRLGSEGDGWKVIVTGLNFERNIFAAEMLGPMREAIKHAFGHAKRRVQFGEPTIEFEENQFKIADMLAQLQTSRLLAYYSAYLLDLNVEAAFEAALAKLYASEAYERLMSDVQQVMGGDGWTRFYPVESFARDSKVNQHATGTSEIMRMMLYRQGTRAMADDLKMPNREIHPKLGVPISTNKPKVVKEINANALLELLAEDYRVNPGLFMSRSDIEEKLSSFKDEQLNQILTALETEGLVKLHRDKRGNIILAKATFKGLRKAKPREYFEWYPEWIDKKLLF